MPWKASGDGLPAMTGEIPQEAIEAGSRDILIGNGWALDLTAYPSGPVREGAAEEVVRAVLTAVLPLIEQRVSRDAYPQAWRYGAAEENARIVAALRAKGTHAADVLADQVEMEAP